MNIIISRHARERGQERFGASSKQIREWAVKSLTEGIDILSDETLRPMAINKARKYNASGMYMFEGRVFIFVDNIVVTVYPVQWLSCAGSIF